MQCSCLSTLYAESLARLLEQPFFFPSKNVLLLRLGFRVYRAARMHPAQWAKTARYLAGPQRHHIKRNANASHSVPWPTAASGVGRNLQFRLVHVGHPHSDTHSHAWPFHSRAYSMGYWPSPKAVYVTENCSVRPPPLHASRISLHRNGAFGANWLSGAKTEAEVTTHGKTP